MDLGALHISDTAVTVIGTLLGVLVGAVVGGLVDFVLERRRESTQAKAAARLLRMELAVRKEQIEDAVSGLLWWPFYDFAMEPWDRYRDLLAGQLDADRWMKVSQSCMELQALGRGMLKSPQARDGHPRLIGAEVAGNLLTMRVNAVEAFNALGEVADDTERLTTGDAPVPGSDKQWKAVGVVSGDADPED